MFHRIYTTLLLLALLPGCKDVNSIRREQAPPHQARYQLTFFTAWDAASFPTHFPSDRHFSPLIGATHSMRVDFWKAGVLASGGMEDMAELGITATLSDEIQPAIDMGLAGSVISGNGITASEDSVIVAFEINQSCPLVTIVSMLAPSPDWFIGVHDVDLFTGGEWVDRLVINLPVYDAGTDDGTRFRSPNLDSVPPEVITLLSSDPEDTDFMNGVHRGDSTRFVGTFTFIRLP